MKQRITIEQLNELTEEQKVNLREWWKPQSGDVLNSIKCGEVVFVYADGQDRLNFDSDGYEWDIKKNCLPLISAGQMIELLDDIFQKDKSIEHDKMQININKTILWIGNSQLCDALWLAVKEVL